MIRPKTILILSVAASFVVAGAVIIYRERDDSRLPLPDLPATIDYRLPLERTQVQIEFYEERAKAEPGISAFNDLARAYYRKGLKTGQEDYFERAKKWTEESFSRQRKFNSGAQLMRIKLLQAQHMFEESLVALNEYTSESTASGESAQLLITAYIATGRIKEAKELSDKLLNEVPVSGAYILAGQVAEELGDAPKAVKLLLSAIQREEVSDANTAAWPRALLARIYLRNGQLEEAKKCLDAVFKIDPDNVMSLRLKAHLLTFEGEYKEAEQMLIRAIGIYADADLFVQLARVKRLASDEKGARELLQTAEKSFRSDLERSHFGHRLQLALMLLEKRDQNSAREALSLVEDELKKRQHPLVFLVGAQAALQAGELESGSKKIQTALAKSWRHPALFLTAAKIAEAKGENGEQFFKQAKIMNPHYTAQCRYCPAF